MADQNISQSLEFLQERVNYLEESNQRFISILEMLASSSEFQDDLSRAKDGTGIFKATIGQLRRLFPFHSIGFLECGSDGSFELVVADPVAAHDPLQVLVETRMLDGTFAWALNRNQAVLVPTEAGESLLLQVLATQSCVRGMFAGTLPGSSATLDAASLNALSIVLYTCAYALESTTLYGLLKDHTQHLEERVQLRTRDLEEARRQAEAASLAKSEFIANMSHEIRTPMNGVMGMTELMLQGGLTPQKEKLYLRAIKDSADSLMLIINDILDFSKIEAGKFTLCYDHFCPRDALERCLGVLLIKAEEKGLQISCQVDPAVPVCLVGDHGRLRQILTNLIGNAIKFCEQGQINIDVGLMSQSVDVVMLHVQVKDTGIGIEQEACQRIFNQFEQADSSTTRRFGGTGLGLAICKKLVGLMDGKIWVESQLGVGSCFHFTARFLLGKAECLAGDKDAALASSQVTQAPREILLADDVEINRALVQAILEPHGHRITIAENGRKAVEAFKSRTFEIVLMDIQMPEMDGLQAARAIRKYEQDCGITTPVPIVAMTAFAGNEDRQICIDAGMDDYLTKPIKPAQLLQVLNKFCAGPLGSVSAAVDTSVLESTKVLPDGPDEKTVVFDKNELMERLGGRSEMIPRFVNLFYKGVLPQMEGLTAALSENDADGVRRYAHAIKGAAGNIAALRIQRMAAIMETAAKQGDLTVAQQRFTMLQNEYKVFTETVSVLGIAVET